MIAEHILDFLETGELVNFPFGTTHQSIVGALGTNPNWTVPLGNSEEKDELIKYGQVELYFTNERFQKLCGVHITYTDPAEEKRLIMDFDLLDEPLPYKEVKEFLTANEIPFEEANDIFTGKVLITASQVEFYFDEDDMLQKFGRFV